MSKVAIIGHVDHGCTSMTPWFTGHNVSVEIKDRPDITVTGDLLKISSYDLTAQLPITRKQRRLNERKNKQL